MSLNFQKKIKKDQYAHLFQNKMIGLFLGDTDFSELVLKKIKKFKSKFDPNTIKKLGMACSYPGTFNSSIYTIINSKNYKDAILKTIKAGGCNCSRANFTGAYFAALKGINSIPNNWIKKTIPAKKILNQK